MAVRGGLTRCARPAGSPPRCAGLSNWLRQLSNPDGGSHHPSRRCNMRKKSLNASSGFLFKYGGERGIRTPDTLPYTHFPGVLLQPLGHLTVLYRCPIPQGQRGATIGSRQERVKQIFFRYHRSVKGCTFRREICVRDTGDGYFGSDCVATHQ